MNHSGRLKDRALFGFKDSCSSWALHEIMASRKPLERLSMLLVFEFVSVRKWWQVKARC